MDPAVERRIQFRMAFENPNAEVRQRIWETLFQQAPIPGREDLNLAVIADRYNIAGGRIRNAFLDACQQAAQVGSINQAILREACEVEMRSSLPTMGTRAIRGFAGYAV